MKLIRKMSREYILEADSLADKLGVRFSDNERACLVVSYSPVTKHPTITLKIERTAEAEV